MKNIPTMIYKKQVPLSIVPINGTYVVGIYQGKLKSPYDFILRYRQKGDNNQWSRIRTPKHIHWAVDILIKHYSEPQETDLLLDFLLTKWEEAEAIKNKRERRKLISKTNLLKTVNSEARNYPKLANKGEYNIKFLILIARLLIVQEKTNYEEAYMFKNLLEQLKKHQDIFKIVSIASHSKSK